MFYFIHDVTMVLVTHPFVIIIVVISSTFCCSAPQPPLRGVVQYRAKKILRISQ